MSTTLADRAATLQILFTTDAEDLARSTTIVRRARKRRFLLGPTCRGIGKSGKKKGNIRLWELVRRLAKK